MSRALRFAVVVVVGLALAACSSGSDRQSRGSAPTSTSSTTLSATTTTSTIAPKPLASKADAYPFTLSSHGSTRAYRLHVPPAAATGAALPLVLNLHGATQNGLIQELQSGMDASADRHGYLVAYPDGTRIAETLEPDPVAKDAQYGWNAGYCCGLPIERHVDDVSFIVGVIDDIAAHTPVDRSRVYVTGMSNGGMMAYALAAQAPQHIAAIASVAGQVELPEIHPSRAVPTIEFHSVDDPVARWNGDANSDSRLRFSVMAGIDQWVKADECDAVAHTDKQIVGTASSNSVGLTATLVRYRGCAAGTEVALWRFTGSGHVWPGASFNTGPPDTWLLDGVGRGTTFVDANEEMWKFFARFTLPAG